MTDHRTSMSPPRWGRAAVVVLSVVVLALPSASAAAPLKCQRAILKQGDIIAQARAKALRRCEEQKRKGRLPPATVCASESATAAKIAKAEAKLAAKIAKDCGGRDKTCGTVDDDTPGSIDWPAQCPDFADGSCAQAIASCADIADCVGCLGDVVIDQAIGLSYAALVPTDKRQQRKLYKCQGAIGAELAKLYAKTSKSLGKCWDKRYKGKHAEACPAPGDGRAGRDIDKARVKFVAKLCKVCGGADKACGGGDDFGPAEIGFAATCPTVGSCGAPVTTLAEVTECLTCVADQGVECAVSASVPGLVAYPDGCAGVGTPTPQPSSSATPIVLESATPTPTVPATPMGDPTPTVTETGHSSATPTPIATPTVSPTGTATTTATVTVTPTPNATATATASPTAQPSVTTTPTSMPTPCAVGSPGDATTLVTISLSTGQAIGAASVLLDYLPQLVRLPTAGGGAAVRDRVSDLTEGDLLDAGAPNNQDTDADHVPDRIRLSLVSTTGVTGAVLAVELDRCDGASPTSAGHYTCVLEHPVAIDGVTPIAGASCSVSVVP